MKEFKTILLSDWNRLRNAERTLQEQTQRYAELKSKYSELELNYLRLLSPTMGPEIHQLKKKFEVTLEAHSKPIGEYDVFNRIAESEHRQETASLDTYLQRSRD